MKTIDAFRVLMARLCVYEAEDAGRLVDRIYLSDQASQALKDAGISLPARHNALKSFKQNRVRAYTPRPEERKKVA